MHGPAILALISLFAASGESSSVDRALELYRQGQLSDALAAFEDARNRGGCTTEDLITIYLHLGILRAGSRDAPGAEQAFTALCTIDPRAEKPRGSSPVVAQPFDRAKTRCGEARGLSIDVRPSNAIDAGTARSLSIEVFGDVAGLVRGARARIFLARGEERVIEAESDLPIVLALPEELTRDPGELRHRLELIDDHGSTLFASGSRNEPRILEVRAPRGAEVAATSTAGAALAAIPARAPDDLDPRLTPAIVDDAGDDSRSLFASPWFWGATGVVAVTGAVILAIVATRGSGAAQLGTPVIEVGQ